MFCGIIAGTEPAEIVQEWTEALAFVPLNPVFHLHIHVVPRVLGDQLMLPWSDPVGQVQR